MALNGRIGYLAPVFIAVAALAAFGCAPMPKAHFYTIAPVASSSAADADTTKPSIRVERLSVAEPYAGRRIVYRPAGSEVDFWEYRRWAESPDMMITAGVAAHVGASGLFGDVDTFPYSWGDVDLILRGAVLAFEEVDKGNDWYGHVKLFLELIDSRSRKTLWSGKVETEKKAAAKTPEALVDALSAALDEALTEAEGGMAPAVERR
jgi:ABC-type uncharacterized transport system auxiliary subunit